MNEDQKPLRNENERLKSFLEKIETEKQDIVNLYERYINL